MAEGPPGACRRGGILRTGGGEQEAARLAARGQDGDRAPRKAASFLRAEGPGRRPVRAASTAVDRKLPDHHDVPLSESIQVRVLRLAGPGAIKNRATQERAQRLDRVGLQQLPRHPAGTEGSTPPGPAEALRRARTRCGAPVMREQGPPGRTATPKGPGATVPAAGPGARAPTWSGAGSRRQQAGRAGGWATPTCIRTWEGFVYLATVPGLLHEESSRVRDWGDSTRHRLRCARRSIWRPAGARTRQEETVFHSIPLRPGVPVHLRAARPASGEI